ncbi:unnamed protein product [Prunus brigantina]
MYKSFAEYRRSVWIMKWSRKGRLERMYVGKRILCASVEGDVEWLYVSLLVVIEDAIGKGPRLWFCPKGLVAELLLTLQVPDLLEENPHGRVGIREGLGC